MYFHSISIGLLDNDGGFLAEERGTVVFYI